MRGCLFVVALGLVVLVAAAWIAGPPVAAGLVSAGLATTGFHAAESSVDVSADPPFELLTGRADTLRLRARDASLSGFAIDRLDLSLHDVDLVGRGAATVDGTLEGVRVGDDADPLPVERIELAGPAGAARATVSVGAAAVEGLGIARVEEALGVRPDAVTLVAPNRLEFRVAGQTVAAELGVNPHADVVARVLARNVELVLVEAASLAPLRASEVTIDGPVAIVRGTLDVEALLR